jgi:hypothetical protein
MMYQHTVTVYDRTTKLVETIPDTVDLAALGHRKYAGSTHQGAPVEAAFTLTWVRVSTLCGRGSARKTTSGPASTTAASSTGST